MYELFISAIFRLVFADCSWPQATKTAESKTMNKGGLLYILTVMEKKILILMEFIIL